MSDRIASTGQAAALYFGDVMHARLKPMGHRFAYRVMSLLINLDRLREADRQSSLFGVNRAALYSFHEADHGPRDGSPLRDYVQACAITHGIDLAGGKVLLLCYPRLFGFTFNPLSVYFCYRKVALSNWSCGTDLRPRPHVRGSGAGGLEAGRAPPRFRRRRPSARPGPTAAGRRACTRPG